MGPEKNRLGANKYYGAQGKSRFIVISVHAYNGRWFGFSHFH